MKSNNGDMYDGNWKNDYLIKGKIKFDNKYIYIGYKILIKYYIIYNINNSYLIFLFI